MRLLRRRSETAAGETVTEAADSPAPEGLGVRRTPGKGRPTPKRREAQRKRTGPVAPPPRTRREAYRRMREQNAVKRADVREGVRSGDERRRLPARDQGPVRALVRDLIDSRRNVGAVFLPVAALVFAGYLIPSAQVRALTVSLWLAVFLLIIVDSVFLGTRIRRAVRARFPDMTERMGLLIWYGVSRAIMIRRWRMPKPRVTVGQQV